MNTQVSEIGLITDFVHSGEVRQSQVFLEKYRLINFQRNENIVFGTYFKSPSEEEIQNSFYIQEQNSP